MIASLAMYDLPWLQVANDRLWAAIAEHLRAAGLAQVPERLTRGADLDEVWRSPRLLLGQTCGYPLMSQLRETVQLVATPHYRAEGCEGAQHRAAIVVRRDDPAHSLADLRGRRVGINSPHSNSGMNLLRAAIGPLAEDGRFFGEVVSTDAHARSSAAVVSGRIDVAAIDAVTLSHLRKRYPRRAEAIRVLEWTAPSPGLPLVTAAETPPAALAALRAALAAVAADPAQRAVLDALLIDRFETLAVEDYAPVLAFEDAAIQQHYPQVA